jgi:cyclophilin family peptidyl-prolyl cis-trans isomerase
MSRGVVVLVLAQVVLLLSFTLTGSITQPTLQSQVEVSGDDGDWRNRTVDPALWADGPELEGSPMDEPQLGDPVIIINVSYVPGHLQSRVEGEIVIELFEEWAPITVTNMVEHIEIDLYDGIFFHRVIDDFVTQGGDPECTTLGIYPSTNLACGSGGTGETIPIEFNENLSHVDGAMGMARGQELDSADSQWYIAETEAHNLDEENSSSGGYATFGVVRDGMRHVRYIALTPTSDDPTGLPFLQNPASTAGRPVYEVHIDSISMLGVVGEDSSLNQNNLNGSINQVSAADGVVFLLVVVIGFVVFSVVMAMVSTAIVRHHRGQEIFQMNAANLGKSFLKYGMFWPIFAILFSFGVYTTFEHLYSKPFTDTDYFENLLICMAYIVGVIICIIAWVIHLNTTTVVQLTASLVTPKEGTETRQ